MRPDPYLGSMDLSNPQSFNRYAYVMNNPMAAVDPSGLWECILNGTHLSQYDDDYDGCIHAGGIDPDQPADCHDEPVCHTPPPPPLPQDFTQPPWDFEGDSDPTGDDLGFQASGAAPNNLTPQDPCIYQGQAKSPQQYARAGSFASLAGPLAFLAYSGFGFPRGSYLDAQPNASGTAVQRAAYGNYVYGVYMAAAKVPYSATMSAANTFARTSHYGAKNGPMDSTYTNLPNANVVNITNGFNALRSGTTCHQ